MNIRNRYLIDNLLVGIIPLFLIFTIFFFLNRKQAEDNVRESLATYIRNFKIDHAADVTKYQDYAYFITQIQADYFRQANPRNLNFPVSIESYNIRLFEVYYRGRFIFRDTYSWKDSQYFSSDETAKKIWAQLSSSEYSVFYKIPYPEIVSNVVVVRSCSIISDPATQEKLGFAAVTTPLDLDYFTQFPLQTDNVIYYIQNKNGFVFSKPDFETAELDETLENVAVDPHLGYAVIDVKDKGRFYCYKENLYRTISRTSNQYVQDMVADIGVLYDYQTVNREFFLFQRVLIIVVGISFTLMLVVSLISSGKITRPILSLKEEVETFEKNLKPVGKPAAVKNEIHTLRTSVAAMSEAIIQKTKELEIERNKLKMQNKTLHDELELARKIQMRYIPDESPFPNVAFLYKPMAQVGGDLFDFVKLPGGKIGIFISDVSGHGVPAAFVTSMIKSFILENAVKFSSPSKFLLTLHDFLINLDTGYFVTAYYGIYDPRTRKFQYANAGHNSPYRVSGENVEMLDETNRNIALAIFSREDLKLYNQSYAAKTVQLSKGDKLLLYTDGLVEAIPVDDMQTKKAADKESFEDVELEKVLRSIAGLTPDEFNRRLMEALEEFRGSPEFDDDVCMICLEV